MALTKTPFNPSEGKLGVFSLEPGQSSWYILDTPSVYFSLAIYHSQLVLVGGMVRGKEHAQREDTDKVWVSEDEGKNWKCSLPPVPTTRHRPLTINSGGNPECLIVAGGSVKVKRDYVASNLIEVLREGHWFTVQPLPKPCCVITKKSTLHEGYWYLTGGRGGKFAKEALCCNLDALVSSRAPASERGAAAKTPTKKIWMECEIPFEYFRLVSLGQHLLAIVQSSSFWSTNMKPSIHAYNPLTQSWTRVQNLSFERIAPIVVEGLPSGELLMTFIGQRSDYSRYHKGFRAWLKGS